jgi:hypothetical protein
MSASGHQKRSLSFSGEFMALNKQVFIMGILFDCGTRL